MWMVALRARLEQDGVSWFQAGFTFGGSIEGVRLNFERGRDADDILIVFEGADFRLSLIADEGASIPGVDGIRNMAEGPDGPLLAVLAPETRRLLYAVIAHRKGSVEFGRVRIHVRRSESIVEQAEAIRLAAALAARLRRVGSPENVLAERASRDPEPHVREAMLRCLLADHADSAMTATALRHAKDDESPAVRRLARLVLPETRSAVLESEPDGCAETLASLPGGLRERVIAGLGRAGTSAEPALLLLLRRPELGWPGDASRIARLTDGRVHEREAAFVAAVDALALAGTAASLAPLQNLGRENPLGGSAVSTAVASAIEAIRERHPDLGAGQLALSDAGSVAGALSNPAQEGALSPAEISRRTEPRRQ